MGLATRKTKIIISYKCIMHHIFDLAMNIISVPMNAHYKKKTRKFRKASNNTTRKIKLKRQNNFV
jgi:hypothetical protein